MSSRMDRQYSQEMRMEMWEKESKIAENRGRKKMTMKELEKYSNFR